MKITKISIANASAVTTVFVWLVCNSGILFFPYQPYMMGQWITHGKTIYKMTQWNLFFPGVFFEGLILVIFAWVTGYVFGWSLEIFSKKKYVI